MECVGVSPFHCPLLAACFSLFSSELQKPQRPSSLREIRKVCRSRRTHMSRHTLFRSKGRATPTGTANGQESAKGGVEFEYAIWTDSMDIQLFCSILLTSMHNGQNTKAHGSVGRQYIKNSSIFESVLCIGHSTDTYPQKHCNTDRALTRTLCAGSPEARAVHRATSLSRFS